MKSKINCLHCGKEAIATQATKKYCSKLCYKRAEFYKYDTKAGKIGSCIVCSAAYIIKRNSHLACSKECSDKHQQTKVKQCNSTHTVSCGHCKNDLQTRNPVQRYCTRECGKLHDNKRKKRVVEVGNFAVFRRDLFRCVYCGQSSIGDGVKLEIDHITPLVAGGTDDVNNLVTSCIQCNRSKSGAVLPAMVVSELRAVVEARNLASNLTQLAELAIGASTMRKAATYRRTMLKRAPAIA
jgi:5-methylcytosine-specific restriction endonuclease McrA